MATEQELDAAREMVVDKVSGVGDAEIEAALRRATELAKKEAPPPMPAEGDGDDWKECVRIAGETLAKHLEAAKGAEPIWNRVAQTIAAYAIWIITVDSC